ncbi:hypothetical protein Ahy_B06g083485 isoform A [Arachis hypogaea]|uniref:Uncharacterized protein n=1 Tax=Arachis hypogaea TaxID=3818 RepID=A0A444YQ26_ARAHY|nr:hypothetical protein Ahy_B06g083485 isoform A [Arachis hypogaea]
MRKYHHSLAFIALQFAFAILHSSFAVCHLPIAVRRSPFAVPRPPQYEGSKEGVVWVSNAAEETVSLAFYMVMSYMFRPMEKNEYFVLDDEEEEAAEMALREEKFEL